MLGSAAGTFTEQRRALCVLVVNVVLLALTAQLFRQDFFGYSRPLPSTQAVAEAQVLCDYVACPYDPRCLNTSIDESTVNCSVQTLKLEPLTFAPRCELDHLFVEDYIPCSLYPGANNTGFSCLQGQCVAMAVDPCVGVVCESPDHECQLPSSQCVDGVCVYENQPDGTQCERGTNDSTILLGSRCLKGVCTRKTASEVTAFAYDSSIASGIISSAFAIEFLLTGTSTPVLAALAINAACINAGWTGYARDYQFESDSGLLRSQNAFVFIAGAISVLSALQTLLSQEREERKWPWLILVGFVFIGGVQLGLVVQLLSQHFTHTNDGVIDNDANIVFNWSYNASIFSAAVTLAMAFSMAITVKYNAGFAVFTLAVNIIALAWASKHNNYGTLLGGDFTNTALTWQSFTFIACGINFIICIILLIKSPKRTTTKPRDRWCAVLLLFISFTLIGFISALYQKHYFDVPINRRGNNFLIVSAQESDNYGNQFSPFAWPISIWTSAVVISFSTEVLINGPSTGITTLALTMCMNLLGWAAAHTYYGSMYIDLFEPLTRGWNGLALTLGAVGIIICMFILLDFGKRSYSSLTVHNNLSSRDRTTGERRETVVERDGTETHAASYY